MADIDFARIMADAIIDATGYNPRDNLVTVLSAPVPALCPDCGGQGVIALPEWEGKTEDCKHWHAPTIGRLLRIGEAVWGATPAKHAEPLWRDLRTVE